MRAWALVPVRWLQGDRGAATLGARPAIRAADLARRLGQETAPFKLNVRKLKELGHTESLEIGYRLSPRGERLLARLEASSG